MLKNFIRGFVVLVALIGSFLLVEKIFMIKSEDGIEQMKSYYLQEEDTVDVIFIGSSHMYCNVNTGTLWDTYGMSAFDLGGAEQPFWNSYYFIKEALKTQKPKVIVMSVTIPGIRFDEYQSEAWLMTNLYGMHWNSNRLDNNKISTLKESYWRLLFPMNTIHGRYTDLSKDDFVDKNYSKAYKGFDLRSTVTPFERPDISGVTEMTPMIPKQEEYLRKIIELTKQENIPLLLVSVPFVVTEEAQKVYNYEFAIAEEEGIDYIDFNKCYDDYGLDFSTDMAEELHLNISGSNKFTKYLGQCLKERYDIADHRGDPKYSSWEENALTERMEIKAVEYILAGDINTYLNMLKDENYVGVIGFDGIYSGLLEDVKEQFGEAGVDVSRIDNGYVSVVNGSKEIFGSDSREFSVVMEEGPDRLVVKRVLDDEDTTTALYIDTEKYEYPGNGIYIMVYDRVLNRLVSVATYSPEENVLYK